MHRMGRDVEAVPRIFAGSSVRESSRPAAVMIPLLQTKKLEGGLLEGGASIGLDITFKLDLVTWDDRATY
jgi:hypothetical protein